MATLAELRESNAKIEQQMTEWKQQRYADGENPLDWVAFREYVRTTGAPDPGDTAPEEFYRWDESILGGHPTDARSTGGTVSEVDNLGGGTGDTSDTGTWPPAAGSGSRTSPWPPAGSSSIP
jgi:hypothetical protein